jgi:hypothetical protein
LHTAGRTSPLLRSGRRAGCAAAAAEDTELGTEIRALRVRMLRFNSPERPGEIEIVFEGPDEDTYWTCIYAGGELRDLEFD